MKTTEDDMKNLYDYMDKMGITYIIDRNPSPEKIEKIKKSIEKRDERIRQMQEDYRSGKLKIS